MISIKDKQKIKIVEKWIVNAIKKMGGGLPQEFYNLDKLPYTFSQPELIEKGVYQVEINLVNVNDFWYPAEIFEEVVSKSSSKFRYLKLKKKYLCYGPAGSETMNMDKSKYGVLSFIPNKGDLDFERIVNKKKFLINTENLLMFVDVNAVKEEANQKKENKTTEDDLF